MLVSKLMNSNVVFLTPDDTAGRAARLLMRHNIGSLPVCSKDGHLRGFVTDRDIALRCAALDNPPEETKLRDIMTRGIVSVSPGDDIHTALNLMSKEQIHRLPVTQNNRIVGMLSLSDILLRGNCKSEISRTLTEIVIPRKRYKQE